VAAYSFPWAANAGAVGVTQYTDMKLVYKWKARALAINDQ